MRSGGNAVAVERASIIISQKDSMVVASPGSLRDMPTMAMASSGAVDATSGTGSANDRSEGGEETDRGVGGEEYPVDDEAVL